MELFFSVDKIPLVPTMTLRFKAAVNMEDKHTLNLDKFHVCVKLLVVLVFIHAPIGTD